MIGIQKIKEKVCIRVAAVNRFIVSRNFVTGEKNILIFRKFAFLQGIIAPY